MSTTQADSTQEEDYSQSEGYDANDDEEEWDTDSMDGDEDVEDEYNDTMDHPFEDIMQHSEFADGLSTAFDRPFSLAGLLTADVRARTQRIVAALRSSTNDDDLRRMALLNAAFSNHLHSAELVALLVDLFGECDRLDLKMAVCKLLHRILVSTSVTTASTYLEILDNRGLFELLASQLTSIEYVDLAEAALPFIAVLCERLPQRAVIFVDCLVATVDFLSAPLQRLVYHSLSFVGDAPRVLPMMQAAVLGDDREIIDSALKTLTRLHALDTLHDRLYELAMQHNLMPSAIDALLSLSSGSMNPQVMIALLRNGHLSEFVRIIDATGRCPSEVESELIRYVCEVPTISDRRAILCILERCFSATNTALSGSGSTLDLERAELVASLFEHGEDVRKLAVCVSSEALLLNGLEKAKDGLLQHVSSTPSSSIDRIQTGWQLLCSLDAQNAPPSMTEEARLIGIAHRAVFRYDMHAKLVQMHHSLDHLLPFAHPVRMSACIRMPGGETVFRDSSTSVDLLMSANELVNVLVSRWRQTSVNPRPPFILTSTDYSDAVLGNEGCMLAPETDSFVLHLVHERNRRIVVGDAENLAAALARTRFPAEPWRHGLEVVRLAASYSIELLPKSVNRSIADDQQPPTELLLAEGPLHTLLQWLKQRHATSLLPSEAFVNARLDAKLAAQLREVLMAALGVYPPHWPALVGEYPFLFSFETKRLYLRVTNFGSIRALHAIGAEGKATRLLRTPRIHLQVDRSAIGAAIQKIALIPRHSLMEVQYEDEIGTGPGPTLEFYTIASRHLASDAQLWSHQGRYPRPRADMTRLALFCERALLDERTIDVDLHEAFFSKLAGASDEHVLRLLDPQLHVLLYERARELVGHPYELPGYPDIPLSQGHGAVITEETLQAYVREVTKALTDCSSFTAATTAIPMHLYRIFTASHLRRLLYGPSHDATQWTVPVFLASIHVDHGYSVASPQIRWLATYVCGLSERLREAFLQWCTGASRLPEGGWAAFKPSLTIVPKAPPSTAMKNGELVGVIEELPSVMTCVNYLKLPRYSSEEVLRQKMDLAIIEGGDSFHLS